MSLATDNSAASQYPIDPVFQELFDRPDIASGEPNCSCGLCLIRVSSHSIGYISLMSFMRFLVTALWAAEQHSAKSSRSCLLNPHWTWINCTGRVRSQAWDVVGDETTQQVRRAANMTSVITLCRSYAASRKTLALLATGSEPSRTMSWKSIDCTSITDALSAIQRDEGMSVADVVRVIRPIWLNQC